MYSFIRCTAASVEPMTGWHFLKVKLIEPQFHRMNPA
uniref:Uncharacterized protein n=1 Tax=Anguilla anguilla TaxID=7936 RepID=A0A0E9VL65_ANGAN